MLSHHKLAVLATVVIVIVVGFIVIPSFDTVGNHWNGYEEIPYEIEGQTYKLLVADTNEKRARGLMDVEKKHMNGFAGMIFLFDDVREQSFYNKNTRLDLTIYWIRNDTVIGKSALPSIDSAGPLTITSPEPVDTVVEIVE